MTDTPCAVDLCCALAVDAEFFCSVHRGTKRAGHVMAGTTCVKCGRTIEAGQWVTRESTVSEVTHVVCPPPAQPLARKKNRPKPLLESEAV